MEDERGSGPFTSRRLRRINWLSAGAFTVGGSLFALGAAEAQLGSGDATTAASIYLAGGIFFTTGGYASVLGVINSPREVVTGGGRPSRSGVGGHTNRSGSPG